MKFAHAGDFWESSDDPEVYKFNQSGQRYVLKTPGRRFQGVTGDADAVIIPVVNAVLKTMVLKGVLKTICRIIARRVLPHLVILSRYLMLLYSALLTHS